MRPLFLEFPHATPDSHPLDFDAPSELFFGPDLLIAPPRFPDKLGSYEVTLPPGNWFNYWTEDQLKDRAHEIVQFFSRFSLRTFAEGPSFPCNPLRKAPMIPQGPLTVRVYPGKNCGGSIYQDDGRSLAYKKGAYLRMRFSCDLLADGVKVHIGAHEGPFHPW